jgi:hypothetical protein
MRSKGHRGTYTYKLRIEPGKNKAELATVNLLRSQLRQSGESEDVGLHLG